MDQQLVEAARRLAEWAEFVVEGKFPDTSKPAMPRKKVARRRGRKGAA